MLQCVARAHLTQLNQSRQTVDSQICVYLCVCLQLCGMDQLWGIALRAQSADISRAAIQYINSYYING